jgi:hypothetical protein
MVAGRNSLRLRISFSISSVYCNNCMEAAGLDWKAERDSKDDDEPLRQQAASSLAARKLSPSERVRSHFVDDQLPLRFFGQTGTVRQKKEASEVVSTEFQFNPNQIRDRILTEDEDHLTKDWRVLGAERRNLAGRQDALSSGLNFNRQSRVKFADPAPATSSHSWRSGRVKEDLPHVHKKIRFGSDPLKKTFKQMWIEKEFGAGQWDGAELIVSGPEVVSRGGSTTSRHRSEFDRFSGPRANDVLSREVENLVPGRVDNIRAFPSKVPAADYEMTDPSMLRREALLRRGRNPPSYN